MFFGTLILEGFWQDFGRVWETQILDFSIFFDVISKQNLKPVSDRQKITKNICFGGGEVAPTCQPPGEPGARGGVRGGV